MKKIGLLWKYFFIYLILTVAISSILVFLSSREIRKHHIAFLKNSLRKKAVLIERIIESFLIDKNFDQLDSEIKEIGKNIGYRITIIGKEGIVFADSEDDPNRMENHSNRPEIYQALKNNFGYTIRYSTTLEEDMLYVAIPAVVEGEKVGVIRVSSYLKDINYAVNSVIIKIILITSILIFLVLIVSFLLSRAFSKPIGEIAKAAENIKKGNFNTRIFIRRKDEIGVLANSINEMARELQRLFNEIKIEKEELKLVLSSMKEALIVISEEGKILLYNESFNKVLNINHDIKGKYYWEIIQNDSFNDLIKDVFTHKNNKIIELEIDNNIFLSNCSLISDISENKVIIVFHNISEMKKLEEIKADFIINTTHELKTPLTSIRGFVETLEKELPETSKNFVAIILRNIDRLNLIVSDLLTLSDLERKNRKIEISEINIKETIDNLVNIFSKTLVKKKIKLKKEIQKDSIFIKADSFWIEQMLINLIDNAIKYNKEKGNITIKVFKNEKGVTFEVEDTGIGIKKENTERIFERFYVVNQSRSRKMGGTGLGLSIVKHIVNLHNGNIEINSEPEKGTNIRIIIPFFE